MRSSKSVVLITGASEGIGRCLAKRFAKEGAVVVLVARNEEKLKEVSDLISGHAADQMICPTDVSDRDAVNATTTRTINKFGKIDILINNAGVVVFGSIAGTPPDMIERAMAVNFWGAVNMIQAAYPFMKQQKRGQIINVSSTSGFQAFPQNGYYCAAKHALNAITDSLRFEAKKDGIEVILVSPDVTTTNLVKNALNATESQRNVPHVGMKPEYVADKIFMASKKHKSKVLIGWKGHLIYWLGIFAPGLLARLITR